jgi:predicted glycosyltransferase
MAGYNTTFEILSFGKPALLVPRTEPRLEQWLRAERLQRLGLLDVLHPDRLNPGAISEWLRSAASEPQATLRPTPYRAAREVLDMDGLSRLPVLLVNLMAPSNRCYTAHAMEGVWHAGS